MVTGIVIFENERSGPMSITGPLPFPPTGAASWARGSAWKAKRPVIRRVPIAEPISLPRSPESHTAEQVPEEQRFCVPAGVGTAYIAFRDSKPPAACKQRAGNEFRLGFRPPVATGEWVGENMSEILRKTAQAWLPVALTAAVVGIGVAFAAW